MAMENKQLAVPHSIIVEDRKNVSISGVTDVESFDEEEVVLMTDLGELIIKGYGLHISKIDVVAGDLALEGEIYNIGYSDPQPGGGGLLSRLFR